MNDDADTFSCHECIGEEYLSKKVLEAGHFGQCSFCDKVAAVIELGELGERVHQAIETYFFQTSTEPAEFEYWLARDGLWERDGDLVGDLICDIALVDSEVGEAIHEFLSHHHDAAGKDALCEEQPYDSAAQYAEKEVDTFELVESWSSFKRNIRTQFRYFNRHAKDVLNEIFHDLDTLTTRNGESVIQEIPVDGPKVDLYRARVALSTHELEEILRSLPKSLGGPPHKHAKSGRMNASGISVFYGALDVNTCITEVRGPVGSSVVIGKFHPLRSLKILDLNRLQKTDVTGSYFDPNHIVELSRARFLEHLVDELSSPVLPGSEERDYLPTQIVAEYLAQLEGLNLDGVMFKSSQVSSKGQNIVLFNHAGGIEAYKLPEGAEVDVQFGQGDPDDFDPTITVWERVPPKNEEQELQPRGNRFFLSPSLHGLNLYDFDNFYPHAPTLRLELESVKVHKIQGVEYKCLSVDVERHRMEKREHDGF